MIKARSKPTVLQLTLARAILREDKKQGPYMQHISISYLAGLLPVEAWLVLRGLKKGKKEAGR